MLDLVILPVKFIFKKRKKKNFPCFQRSTKAVLIFLSFPVRWQIVCIMPTRQFSQSNSCYECSFSNQLLPQLPSQSGDNSGKLLCYYLHIFQSEFQLCLSVGWGEYMWRVEGVADCQVESQLYQLFCFTVDRRNGWNSNKYTKHGYCI